jgi:hypothetical protein
VLVGLLSPRSVLVTGGDARGALADDLRDRDIEVDDVDPAVLQAGPDHAERRQARHYDLVVCLGPLPLPAEGPAELVAAMAASGDAVLFSAETSTDQAAPPTNEHVADWSKAFADHGLFRDFTHDASYLSPAAVLYRPSRPSSATLVQLYERALHDAEEGARAQLEMLEAERQQLRKEILRVRDLAFGRQAELASALARVEQLEGMLGRYDNLEQRLHDMLDSRSWRVTQTIGLPIRMLRQRR